MAPQPIATEKPHDVLARIKWSRPYLNPALRRIADYVLKHPEQVKGNSIRDLAHACKVSESTITRFVQSLDVSNFQLLKIRIAEELSLRKAPGPTLEDNRLVYEDITKADDAQGVVSKISGRYLETVRDTQNGLSAREVERAVEAIEACELMTFFALGSSTIAVENALMRFMRIGKQCQYFREFSLRQISIATLNTKSVAIGISNSGRTIMTANCLKEAREQGATTICITSFPDSPITQHADIKLFTPTVNAAGGSADYHESMVSKIAQLQVIDILYSWYAVKNYDKSIDTLERTDVYSVQTRF